MIACGHDKVSGWGDDSIRTRTQHDCIVGVIGFLGGAMIACGHARNMTALLGHKVSGWGDDSIRTRMQHDCIVRS